MGTKLYKSEPKYINGHGLLYIYIIMLEAIPLRPSATNLLIGNTPRYTHTNSTEQDIGINFLYLYR